MRLFCQQAETLCRSCRACLLLCLGIAALQGCSSGWRAPSEVRGAPVSSSESNDSIQGVSYRVQQGDTLYAIAWRAGKDFRELARWNGIRSPYTIYPGQVLRLTAPASSTPKSTKGSQTASARESTRSAPKSPGNTSSKSTPRTSKPSPKQAVSKPSPPPPSSDNLRWTWPTKGPLVATFSASEQTRQGIKIGGSEGQAITAAEGGRVVYSGSGLIGYGRLIIIKHNDNYLSAYGHNRQLLVKEGDQVKKGDRIAEMGRSNDGKPMLHFEIRRVGKPVDPLPLLPRQQG